VKSTFNELFDVGGRDAVFLREISIKNEKKANKNEHGEFTNLKFGYNQRARGLVLFGVFSSVILCAAHLVLCVCCFSAKTFLEAPILTPSSRGIHFVSRF
jgi:hypothetical protein